MISVKRKKESLLILTKKILFWWKSVLMNLPLLAVVCFTLVSRTSMGEESCLKPSLTELKLEPDTENHLDIHSAARKSDKVLVTQYCTMYQKW